VISGYNLRRTWLVTMLLPSADVATVKAASITMSSQVLSAMAVTDCFLHKVLVKASIQAYQSGECIKKKSLQ
jgi:hypothetical protein